MLIAFSYSRTVACANGREKRELAVTQQAVLAEYAEEIGPNVSS